MTTVLLINTTKAQRGQHLPENQLQCRAIHQSSALHAPNYINGYFKTKIIQKNILVGNIQHNYREISSKVSLRTYSAKIPASQNWQKTVLDAQL